MKPKYIALLVLIFSVVTFTQIASAIEPKQPGDLPPSDGRLDDEIIKCLADVQGSLTASPATIEFKDSATNLRDYLLKKRYVYY